MKLTCIPIVLSYGTIACPDAGMDVAPLHLIKSNTKKQLLIPSPVKETAATSHKRHS